MATEMSSGASNQPPGIPVLDLGLLGRHETGFLVLLQTEGGFVDLSSVDWGEELAAAAARFFSPGGGSGVRHVRTRGAYTNEQSVPRTSNEAMIAIDQCLVFDGNPIFQAHPAGRGGSNAVPVLEPNYGAMINHVWDGVLPLVVQRVGGRPHLRYTIGGGGGPIILGIGEESSPGLTVLGRGGGQAIGGQLNGDMLTALGLRGAIRGHNGGSQALLVDENGGPFLAIHINPPQQADQGLEAPRFRAQKGPGDIAQRALQSAFGGLVPLCYTVVDGGILKGGSPGYIKAAAYAGLGLITGFTFLGLISKKRANAAVRVVASTAIAAASAAIVYNVSENVYIKCVCGITGAVATLATAAIDW